MRIDCGYCKSSFALSAENVKQKIVERNPFSVLIIEALGISTGSKKSEYYVVCLKCKKAVGKFWSPFIDI